MKGVDDDSRASTARQRRAPQPPALRLSKEAEQSQAAYRASPTYPFSDGEDGRRRPMAREMPPRERRLAAAAARAEARGLEPALSPEAKVEALKGRKLNHKIVNTKLLRVEDLEELAELVATFGELMNFVNVSTAMARARVQSKRARSHQARRHTLMRELERRMYQERAHWSAYGVVQCVYAAAKCAFPLQPRTRAAVTEFATAQIDGGDADEPGTCPRLDSFEPQGLALLLWATHAGIGWESDDGAAAKSLLEAAAPKLAASEFREEEGWTPQALSLVAWAYAKGGLAAPDVMNRISAAVLARPREALIPEQIANLAWAFAELGHHDGPLFAHLAAAAIPHATPLPLNTKAFPRPALTRMAAAFGRARQPAAALFAALSQAALEGDFLERLSPGELSALVWGFARTGVTDTALFDAVSSRIMGRYEPSGSASPREEEFLEDELADLLWAYTESGHRDPALVGMVIAELYA